MAAAPALPDGCRDLLTAATRHRDFGCWPFTEEAWSAIVATVPHAATAIVLPATIAAARYRMVQLAGRGDGTEAKQLAAVGDAAAALLSALEALGARARRRVPRFREAYLIASRLRELNHSLVYDEPGEPPAWERDDDERQAGRPQDRANLMFAKRLRCAWQDAGVSRIPASYRRAVSDGLRPFDLAHRAWLGPSMLPDTPGTWEELDRRAQRFSE